MLFHAVPGIGFVHGFLALVGVEQIEDGSDQLSLGLFRETIHELDTIVGDIGFHSDNFGLFHDVRIIFFQRGAGIHIGGREIAVAIVNAGGGSFVGACFNHFAQVGIGIDSHTLEHDGGDDHAAGAEGIRNAPGGAFQIFDGLEAAVSADQELAIVGSAAVAGGNQSGLRATLFRS